MIEDAPTNEPVGDGWTFTWTLWFKNLQMHVAAWRKTVKTSLTHNFGNVAATSRSSTTLAVRGARSGDLVLVTPYPSTLNLHQYGEITADDTLTLYADNPTAGGINPPETSYRIIVFMQ
jgi:hypothetical protein